MIKRILIDNKFIISIFVISFLSIVSINYFIFPYYSNNHDEGVYIFQAKMLVEGNIYLKNNEYSNFFDMWFIINDGEKIYPRYTPIHSLILSIFYILFKDMRIAIGIISGTSLIFLYLVTKELYNNDNDNNIDIPIFATLICLSSPLFLIISSTYLSYTTSFLLSLIFIYFFIKSLKEHSVDSTSLRNPLISGMSLGLLFFDRPYDAILVGTPFILYLIYVTYKNARENIKNGNGRDSDIRNNIKLKKLFIGSISFLSIFLIALLYNNLLTGDPFLFPFSKYEPLDTIGFGIKRVSPYSPVYLFTIDSSIYATKTFIYQLLFNWTVGGIFLIFSITILRKFSIYEKLLLILFVSIIIGNFIFWGPYHILKWENSMNMFGPIYYFNLLLPISIISGRIISDLNIELNNKFYGIKNVDRNKNIRKNIRSILLISIFVANIWLFYPKLESNYNYTEKNEKIYNSIFDTIKNDDKDSLVFLPTIYGPYIQHPFGYLINDPSFNGSIVYSKDLGNRNIQLMKRYEGRNFYIYQYNGKYTESYNDNISGTLTKLNLVKDKEIKIDITITNPTDKEFVIAYIWNNGNTDSYILDNNSRKNKSYNVKMILSHKGIINNTDYKFKLSEDTSLIIGSALSDSPYLTDAKKVYEYRHSFNIDKENIFLSLPADGWKNENYPYSDWTKSDIKGVISIDYIS